jgi:hypothetical protein
MTKRGEAYTELTAQELHEKYCKAKDLIEHNHWHIHRAEHPFSITRLLLSVLVNFTLNFPPQRLLGSLNIVCYLAVFLSAYTA